MWPDLPYPSLLDHVLWWSLFSVVSVTVVVSLGVAVRRHLREYRMYKRAKSLMYMAEHLNWGEDEHA